MVNAYLHSSYAYAGIDPLTNQQEQFVLGLLRGLRPASAARSAGYSQPAETSYSLLTNSKIKAILTHLKNEEFENIKVNRDQLTMMLFEAHSKSATATEEIAAVREIGKMHGLYEPEKVQSLNVNSNLENMADEDLVKLANM
jgi:phage terminase small subunit